MKILRISIITLYLLLPLQVLILPAEADVLYLKNGEKLRGIVSQNKDTYTIQMPWGKATFSAQDVERVEKETLLSYHQNNAQELLEQRELVKAWDEYKLWKKNGGQKTDLAAFEQEYYAELGRYFIRKGELSKAGKVIGRMDNGAEKKKLSTYINEFTQQIKTLISEADKDYTSGKMQTAFRKYRQAHILCPEKLEEFKRNYIETHVEFAQGMMKEGKYVAATYIFDAAFSLDPSLFRRVRKLWVESKMKVIKENYENNKWENCREMIYNLVDINPESVQVLITAGDMSIKLGQYRDAYNYYAEICNEKIRPKGDIPTPDTVKQLQQKAQVLSEKGERKQIGTLSRDGSSKYITYSSPHFKVSAVSRKTAERACIVLEHFFRRIRSRFPPEQQIKLWDAPCTVIILPDRESFIKKTGFDGEAGVTYLHFDSTTNLYKPVVFSHEDAAGLYLSSLAHELGHVIFSYL
ncbi:tetratricopeptide repeat protein, partial [Planctomycetota bacterium]